MNLKELRTALKERREDYSPSDAKLNRTINQAYLDICSRRKWGWLRREFTANVRNSILATGVDPAVTANSRIFANKGERSIRIESGIDPIGMNVGWGRRILFNSTFYDVIQTTNPTGDIILWLDRQYTGPTYPNALVTPTDYGTITFLSNEVALPLGTKSLVEAVLFSGTNSYPLGLSSVSPYLMARNNKGVLGQPTSASVIQKVPLPHPKSAISSFGVFTTVGVGGLTPSSIYTYWYTYVDNGTGAESSLSPPSTVTLGATDTSVTLPTVTARNEFGLRFYRSDAGGSVPYWQSQWEEPIQASWAPVDVTSDEELGTRAPDSSSSMFLSLYPAPASVASTGVVANTVPSAYELHCLYESEALAMGDDYDKPLFDASFSPVLLDGGEYLMLTSSDEQGRAQSAKRSYEMGIARMITQDRLNFQEKILIGRNGRRLRGMPNTWDGAFPDYGNSGGGAP